MPIVRTPTLAQEMAALPEPPSNSRAPFWDFWRHDLWTRAQAEPPENFMGWPCIRHTMTVQHFDIEFQVDYLRRDWARWERVCGLPKVGQPRDEYQRTGLSRNLLNQAYSLKLWEDTTGRRVEDQLDIYEFGGGYGAMALLCHRLGFRGNYFIQDLPEFAALQRWFLSQSLLEGEVLRLEHSDLQGQMDLLIGLYSISETPIEFRREWLATHDPDSWLLLYSSQFADYDNFAWARELVAARPEHTWHVTPFQGRPDWYAIGWQP